MKRFYLYTVATLFVLWLVTSQGFSQDTPSTSTEESAISEDTSEDEYYSSSDDEESPLSGFGDLGSMGINIDFFQADSFELSAETGDVIVKGNVDIRSPGFNIKCDQIVTNTRDESKKTIATGNPVELDNNEGLDAKCKKLTYFEKNKLKTYLLEGDPVVHQKNKDGSITKISNATITITQSPKSGYGVTFKPIPGSNARPKLEKIPAPKAASSGNETPRQPAVKIDKNNEHILKMPEIGD